MMMLLSPVLSILGTMALKMMTASAIEDIVLYGLGRLRDNVESKANQELIDVVVKHLKD